MPKMCFERVARSGGGTKSVRKGPECGRFQYKSMGGLLESNAIRERKNMAAELEDNRE